MSMKSVVKMILKETVLWQKRVANKYFNSRRYQGLSETERTNRRIVFYNGNKMSQYQTMFSNIEIVIDREKRFQHWIDTGYFFYNRNQLNDAISPDYSLILKNSINELINQNNNPNNKICFQNSILLESVKEYINKIISAIQREIDTSSQTEKLLITKIYFERMLNHPAISLEEGLQRILFWESLFWQTGHTLVGLGRLDYILDGLEVPKDKTLLYEIIIDFFKELHDYYGYKSNELLGDTGQIIILGGKNDNRTYFCNEITYAFLNALMLYKVPDPKIVLRVSSGMPSELLELGLRCISTGIGSPLLANDDIIIPALESFGYSYRDSCNYITSACWEPFAYGSSWGRGNLGDINFAKVLVYTYEDERFEKSENFEQVFEIYKEKLLTEVSGILSKLDYICWEYNPLMTLFTRGCIEKQLDVSEGGAEHCDYGILSVGLANAVNSLINIDRLIFKGTSLYTLKDLKRAAMENFVFDEELQSNLRGNNYFGRDNPEVLNLVADLVSVVEKYCSRYTNLYGGKVRFGFSSPNYLSEGKKCKATLDGRKRSNALSVHISTQGGIAYTELISFAGKQEYSNLRCNGSVVDLMFSPQFIESNFDKLIIMLKSAINIGFFEMQINVVSSTHLVDAKNNPDKYPNLIVRVWGFSAYFNDLPEEYQNVLIQRAIENEKAV